MARKGNKVRMFSALEVAGICGVVNQTAINWIKSGHLKAFQTPGGQYRVYADDLLSFLAEHGMRIPEGLLASTPGAAVDMHQVLIVDDDRAINGVLKRFLQKGLPGHRFLQAYDGFEAGRLLAEHHPGVVILDIGLPGIDGHVLCRKIKTDPSLGNPIVVAVTGLDESAEAPAIRQEGADAFFAKPLDFSALCASIRELESARTAVGAAP
jgi:two-component system OmpR family response regulator